MSLPNGVITIGSIDAFNNLLHSFRENIIIFEFFADWCGPCKNFRPVYEEIQKLYYEKGVIFARVNSEEFPEVMEQFNIQGVPSMIFVKNGKGLHRLAGALTRTQFLQVLESVITKAKST
jgi:thioredoxin